MTDKRWVDEVIIDRNRALAAAKELRAALLTQPGDYATAEAGVAWQLLKIRALAATAWVDDR